MDVAGLATHCRIIDYYFLALSVSVRMVVTIDVINLVFLCGQLSANSTQITLIYKWTQINKIYTEWTIEHHNKHRREKLNNTNYYYYSKQIALKFEQFNNVS